MIIGLPLTADQIASIGTGINFIRLKMGGRMFYPTNMSADNSSIQSWIIQIKNNSQGGFSEGAFAGDPAEIAWSSDNQNWLTIIKGQVDGSGAKRVEGNQTDDYLTFSIKDYAEAWGTSKDIDDTVLCGYRICDPSNPGSSIVHWLAGKMGLTADQVDCGTISQVLDLVQISGTPWSNLQKLGEAYGVSVRFTGDGKLWFHSVCETGFTEPSNEWTIDADLNNLASDSHSNAIGKISSSFLKRTCTKAESSFSTYKLLSRQQIYKCTENANSSTGYCHVEVKANSTYPEEGVMELKYKDPSTGEEFAHAIEVETPTVGTAESCEIFATGELTLDYFSADDVQGSARIRLKNSTSSAIYIKKLVLYGKPYSKQDDTKVTYELSTVPEEEKADSSVDGTFGTTSALMTTVLKRKCSIEGIRRREFSLSTWFLPQVQLGMGVQIRKAGEIISCTVASYRHSLTGKTLATLRTDLTLEEISEFVPDEDPDIIIHNPNYSLSTKGDKGDSGETPVTLYAVGSSRTAAPELSATWGSSEGEWGSSEGSWGIRVEWASEAPAVPAGFYLWSKSKLPSEAVWSYVCLTGEQGEQGNPGTDAVAFSIYSDKSTYRISQRNTEDQTIIFGYSIENQTGTVAWTIDASGTVSISGSVVTVLPECTLSQFTVTATLSRDGAVVDTKTITINGVVQEDVPVYLGMFTADPAASATSVAKFIRGDFYLRTDITDNGDGTFTNTATTLFPFVFDTSLTPERFRKVDSNQEPRFSEICGSILADVGKFIALKPGCSSPELYVYFKTILTEYINAKTVSAMNLRLQSGGKIESSEFYWDAENNNNADTGSEDTTRRGFRYKDNGDTYTTNQHAENLTATNLRATENSRLEGSVVNDFFQTRTKGTAGNSHSLTMSKLWWIESALYSLLSPTGTNAILDAAGSYTDDSGTSHSISKFICYSSTSVYLTLKAFEYITAFGSAGAKSWTSTMTGTVRISFTAPKSTHTTYTYYWSSSSSSGSGRVVPSSQSRPSNPSVGDTYYTISNVEEVSGSSPTTYTWTKTTYTYSRTSTENSGKVYCSITRNGTQVYYGASGSRVSISCTLNDVIAIVPDDSSYSFETNGSWYIELSFGTTGVKLLDSATAAWIEIVSSTWHTNVLSFTSPASATNLTLATKYLPDATFFLWQNTVGGVTSDLERGALIPMESTSSLKDSGGTTRVIRYGFKDAERDSLTFDFVDASGNIKSYTYESGGMYDYNPDIVWQVMTIAGGIDAGTILPLSDSDDIGASSKKYRDIYSNNIYSNVNSQDTATAVKVYGAVFN